MKIRIFYIYLVLMVLASTGCQQKKNEISAFRQGKWIDLTYAFDAESVYWPTNIPFTHDTVFEGINDKGYYYSSFRYCAEEHGGTHFDAPLHFFEGGNSIDEVPLDQLMGKGVVIDVCDSAKANRDYQLTIADVLAWEKQHGRIPDQAVVLINTGFSRYYPDKLSYTGTTLRGKEAVAHLHFPGIHPDAAKFLATERKINGIGLDTPSIDYGQSTDFMTHRILFANNITAYENVAGMEELPAKGSWILALPMKIKGGSGAPLRLVAFIPELL